jgi:DNA helicase-2/ATP-dependent DNA helicase PcrA
VGGRRLLWQRARGRAVTVALSAAQLAVVQHRGADLQVIACAGSGKTESVSRRIAALIEEGAEPASIVAFTFTERAAAELKERIVRRVAERMGAAFRDRLGPMFVGTIHAYCFRVLQDHVPRYGSYDVLDDNRHAGLLSREHKAIGLSRLGSKHWQPIRDFAKAVDVIGNELIPTSAFDGTPARRVPARVSRDPRSLPLPHLLDDHLGRGRGARGPGGPTPARSAACAT